ncbi:helix-turn-helix domain-containing protein [Streptomyces sp. NBC_01433]|uniref:GbsR/MarR family transcriptional regulator n=1 Tax=Streptomyces sp. NBC_01433 TaxID=2903864 RepID=UPI0022571098|nr:MarR family transcriptional regulator [Streptomyces sp. NBC_01433]MCX4674335.1 helix-turn-helix domain-containing protein [Streptomyces sp. NBC_01433]
MGGGRLTAEDRRGIEAGLAEDLPYAVIARRLGRPTSTVSREVARNSGPGGYRAEHADRAAAWQRRNRPPRPPAPPVADFEATSGRDPATIRAYEDRFATMMIATGLPRTAARVLACLVTAPSGARTAAELAQRLRVSPASVSKAVGYLEGLDVLTREREPGLRRERYVIDDDVWLRTWRTSAQKNEAWAETAQQGAELFGLSTPAGARLEAMRTFFVGVHRDMTGRSSAALNDAGTVLVALLHAARPLTSSELAAALGWPEERVATAVEIAEQQPEVCGPLTLQHTPSGAHLATAQNGRLTPAQCTALVRRPGGCKSGVRGEPG